ncbi:MAG: prephenate/arogenate dehydrogenase [Elainellaceae cyanobacterium]
MIIGIVGLGLIGGSLAIDFKAQQHTVLGMSRRAETCQQAIARGMVDHASAEPMLMADADVIFLCTPLAALEPTVRTLLPYLAPRTILTDVGSVKTPVVNAIAPIWSNFVGGHPMAGTAEHGLDAAQANLFINRSYVLTPIDHTPTSSVDIVMQLARSLGATVYHCQPSDHDRAVAWISHLPVMVSASLITACLKEDDSRVLKLAKILASSGFRDTSRVGGGNPELGLMMAQYNQTELVRSLHIYRDHLNQIISAIERDDWQTLEETLQHTQHARHDFVN